MENLEHPDHNKHIPKWYNFWDALQAVSWIHEVDGKIREILIVAMCDLIERR